MVVIDLWPSQRDTSEMGTPSASAVLAKVCLQIVEGGVRREPCGGYGGLPDLAVVVVTAQKRPSRGAAQHGVLAEIQAGHVVGDRIQEESRHGHVAQRRGGLRRCQDRAAVNDNDLLVDGDHSGGGVDAVQGETECLALAEPGTRTQQDEQRVPLRHGIGQREDLSRGEQPDDGLADFRQPDVDAGCLADVTVTDSAAHDAGENDVDSLNGAWREALNRLEVFDPLLHHSGPDSGQPVTPKHGHDVVSEMQFVGVNRSGLVQP